MNSMACRDRVKLHEGWYVSASAHDAELAARKPEFADRELELAGDVENRPALVYLPGGREYGKRPPHADGKRYPSAWLSYAKQVSIPAEWAGRDILLVLDNVRYHVTVKVNGAEAARYVGGLEPHRVDITHRVQPGEMAVVVITVGDAGVSGKRPFDTNHFTGTRLPTCAEIQDNLVHPVNYGGADRAVGQVHLEALPKLRVEHVLGQARWADRHVVWRVSVFCHCLINGPVRVQSVASDGTVLLEREVELRPNERRDLTDLTAWPEVQPWDLATPHLYTVETTIYHGNRLLDRHTDSYGFREFGIDGPNFLLNGTPIHLHGQSGHTSPDRDWMSLDEKIAYLRAWKEQGHVNHFRLHAKPQHREWVEAADRVGMLVTTETALWTTGFSSFDFVGEEEACFQNICNHFLEALVRRDRNNPSVVIWSLSNEMSPITPFDLELPKMAALTRILERTIAAAKEDDPSRVIQMSSAMDFLGRLAMYNLHYPKSWQAFPDYPHTAYWIDQPYRFPWYGPRRAELPAWTWRRDKPLYIGEFTCVYGMTPDAQATIIGDEAFERADFGTARVNEKLWPLEIRAYRRAGVSGFCAWAAMFPEEKDVAAMLARPHLQRHSHELRPVAALLHTYRRDWFAGDDLEFELSVHNDLRQPARLAMMVELSAADRIVQRLRWPAATCAPATSRPVRFILKAPAEPGTAILRVTLREGAAVVDVWEEPLAIAPRLAERILAESLAVYDPDGELRPRFEARGIRGGTWLDRLDAIPSGCRSLWLPCLRKREWQAYRHLLEDFVNDGGVAILDRPATAVLGELPVPLSESPGYGPEGRLEITCARNAAPHHPVASGWSDELLSLWGADYYVARRCLAVTESGNAVPLLVAGTDRRGLIDSPLMEVRAGRGAWLVSTLELLPKLLEEPRVAAMVASLAEYRVPEPLTGGLALAAGNDTRRRLGEVGWRGKTVPVETALQAKTALLDGALLDAGHLPLVRSALAAGSRLVLHALSPEQSTALLHCLELPGEVADTADQLAWDTIRHAHRLADGMTSNQLYWIVDKAKVAMWTRAPLHPRPATAHIRLPEGYRTACSLTRRGAITVYPVGPGLLVIDNLNWQDAAIEEAERPRRYLSRLLTNLGVALEPAAVADRGEDTESEAERRERGHF